MAKVWRRLKAAPGILAQSNCDVWSPEDEADFRSGAFFPDFVSRSAHCPVQRLHKREKLLFCIQVVDTEKALLQNSQMGDESRFNLWDHDGCIRVRRHADERGLPECVIEPHSGLRPGDMLWGAISYDGRPNLLRIEGIPGVIFQQDNARPHVAKTVRDFCLAQHMQLLPWPAYSPDMSPIEYVWDLVSWRLARDPRPAASKNEEFLLCIQAIWSSLPQADIQNLFDSMPRRIAALIAARGGNTKY
ncbi:transposable element Tcb2 transposase [Trichonephila clavipes]|nr:transposable element Tcb2 transposase [Trichonephila clavipes]